MIKTIIFDSGGVIVDQRLFFKRLNKLFRPKNKKKFWRQINIEAIPLCKNLISEEVFWKKIAELNRKNPDKVPKTLWREDYEKLTKIDKGVLNIIKKLRRHYKLALISNSIRFHEKINRKSGILDFFDVVTLSHKVGLTKDNQKIFLLTAKKLKVKPEDCIFIDDLEDYVNVAKSTGMEGIIFRNDRQLALSLKKFNV